MVSKEQALAESSPSPGLPPAFAEQPRVAQLVAALAAPAVLGAISGLALGIWAPAYWALQALALIGGLFAGLEHNGAPSGARRGLLGGFLFGSFLLLVHYASGLDPHASLGHVPALLVVVTGAIGSALGALGGRYRARRLRS